MASPSSAPGPAGLDGAASDGPDLMGREIAEGPDAVAATLRDVAMNAASVQPMLDGAGRIVILATGAALAASLVAVTFWRARLQDRKEVLVRQSTEALLGDLDGSSIRSDDVVLAVSQSGASPETVAAARAASAAGARVLAITAHPDSVLTETADAVIALGSGEERGAATKSELATLAALLALAGEIRTAADAVRQLRDRLAGTVHKWADATTAGALLAEADRVWLLGFGPALGLAQAALLLWHEKVRRPAVAATPSEFRHGLIEAATERCAAVLIDVDAPHLRRIAYLNRLRSELEALYVNVVELTDGGAPPSELAPAEQALDALVRLQQLARATALAAGTYREEFAILRRVVTPATDLLR